MPTDRRPPGILVPNRPARTGSAGPQAHQLVGVRARAVEARQCRDPGKGEGRGRKGKGRPRAQERICLCRRCAGECSRRAGGGECTRACAGGSGMRAGYGHLTDPCRVRKLPAAARKIPCGGPPLIREEGCTPRPSHPGGSAYNASRCDHAQGGNEHERTVSNRD
jgi:hypothetical protein